MWFVVSTSVYETSSLLSLAINAFDKGVCNIDCVIKTTVSFDYDMWDKLLFDLGPLCPNCFISLLRHMSSVPTNVDLSAFMTPRFLLDIHDPLIVVFGFCVWPSMFIMVFTMSALSISTIFCFFFYHFDFDFFKKTLIIRFSSSFLEYWHILLCSKYVVILTQ